MSLYNYYKYIIQPDFLTKFNYKNINDLFKIKKIVLIFIFMEVNSKNFFTIKDLLKGLLILELLSNQKSCIYPIYKKIKNKNKLIGFNCKVTLRNMTIFKFLNTLLILKKKDFLINMLDKTYYINNRGHCSFSLKNILNFKVIPSSLFFQWKIPLQIYIILNYVPKLLQKKSIYFFNSFTLLKKIEK